MTRIPAPTGTGDEAVRWLDQHLAGLFRDEPSASAAFRGGQTEADRRLDRFDVSGYATRRNEVLPTDRRGASALSPYIRHGLLPLPRVWDAVADGPRRDRDKFRDELLWQEYARHLYARLGPATRRGIRHDIAVGGRNESVPQPWPRSMACVSTNLDELHEDGWLVNQTRMWLASHWSVRVGAPWQDGEDEFFAHLLDGSRAANRLGWQWTTGTATGRAYGFSRSQVERRAPGLCARCDLAANCPIADWPDDPPLEPTDEHPLLRSDSDPESTGGPRSTVVTGTPEAVWITAESLGDDDPALAAHPGLPAIFVFDEPLLAGLRLSAKRLVFLAECLADLATRRPVEVHRGRPMEILTDRQVATTFVPVPGWKRRSARIRPVEVHPWPWLRRPHGRSVASFSAWRKATSRG